MAVARRARWGGTWRRGEEMRTMGMSYGVAAGAGVPFIGLRRVRRGGTGEASGRQWWGLNSRLFRGVKGGGESTGTEIVRESEGGRAALQFGSIRVQEGSHQWHATRRHGWMGSLGILKKEKGPGWAGARPQRPGGPERSGGLKRVDGP
jgi:hypothetical protein